MEGEGEAIEKWIIFPREFAKPPYQSLFQDFLAVKFLKDKEDEMTKSKTLLDFIAKERERERKEFME